MGKKSQPEPEKETTSGWRVKTPISRERLYQPGEIIQLTDKEAAQMPWAVEKIGD